VKLFEESEDAGWLLVVDVKTWYRGNGV